jgi:ABC-2 type transport system ATP-binding protein
MEFGAEQVTVEIDGKTVLDDLTLTVPRGAVTAVVGGDGAGKSTLLRCLVGLRTPARGVVHRPAKTQLGYMPSTSGTWRELSVAENMSFVGRVYAIEPQVCASRTEGLLQQAGLAAAAERLAGDLSGGMRQKLGFCMALLHEPLLLVLDEPSTGVDAVSRVELWRLIAQAAARGSAVVMATTYLDEAERASSVLALDRGRSLLAGEPAAVLASMNGAVVEVGEPSAMTWRRGGTFHEWIPDGAQADVLAMTSRATRVFGSFTAVDDVSIEVGRGEIVGLLGANGAGKTTLIRLMLGLLPVSSGSVSMFGEPPSRRTRARLGYVPQGLGLYMDLTVAETCASTRPPSVSKRRAPTFRMRSLRCTRASWVRSGWVASASSPSHAH